MFDDHPPTNQKDTLLQAAKAAGFWKYEYQNWPGLEVRYGYAEALWVIPDEPAEGEEHLHGFYWNPIDDDSDAFLLMTRTRQIDLVTTSTLNALAKPNVQEVGGTRLYREAVVQAAIIDAAPNTLDSSK